VKVEFIVQGNPVPQPRQRLGLKYIGGKLRPANYTPKDDPVNTWKNMIRLVARQAHDGDILTGPIQCELTCVFPRPKFMQRKTIATPRVFHAKKPDIDNLQKSVFDALNGYLWKDDSQISQVTASKFIASGDELPHLRFVARCIGGDGTVQSDAEYRRRDSVATCLQWTGGNAQRIGQLAECQPIPIDEMLAVDTQAGTVLMCLGDWLCRSSHGLTVLRPEEFERTFIRE
jgi:Holliday junction resolvase RusA-like endonuclease